MDYKKIMELSSEAYMLEQVHSDYMKGNIVKEHDVNFIRERLSDIRREIIKNCDPLYCVQQELKKTNFPQFDFNNAIRCGIDLGVVDKDGDMFTKDCKFTFAPKFTVLERNEETKEITKVDLHSVSMVRK